jgi:hypothetical protein
LARDIVHRQLGVLAEPPVDAVRASDNLEQGGIDFGFIVGALDCSCSC